MTRRFHRRSLLRGTLAGGAVTMGLPLLDCFLNDNGTALAQGAPIPIRYGSWMWGCVMRKFVGHILDLVIAFVCIITMIGLLYSAYANTVPMAFRLLF